MWIERGTANPGKSAKKNSMKNLLRFLRSLKSCRNRRRHSRLPFLGESMAWFNAPTRR